jgi:hypothetical protein
MFERIKNALAARAGRKLASDGIQRWASSHHLTHQSRPGGGFVISGLWMDRLFRVECAPSTRSYIQGFELKAKAELAVTHEVGLVLMNRALKRTFEAQANALYEDATDALKTRTRQLPEEVRWLSMYRDAGWPGPDDEFWARYAVLTDAADVARNGLDADAIGLLMEWPAPAHERTPMLFMLNRGNTYLRMQLAQPGDEAVAVHALTAFGHFTSRFASLLAR